MSREVFVDVVSILSSVLVVTSYENDRDVLGEHIYAGIQPAVENSLFVFGGRKHVTVQQDEVILGEIDIGTKPFDVISASVYVIENEEFEFVGVVAEGLESVWLLLVNDGRSNFAKLGIIGIVPSCNCLRENPIHVFGPRFQTSKADRMYGLMCESASETRFIDALMLFAVEMLSVVFGAFYPRGRRHVSFPYDGDGVFRHVTEPWPVSDLDGALVLRHQGSRAEHACQNNQKFFHNSTFVIQSFPADMDGKCKFTYFMPIKEARNCR